MRDSKKRRVKGETSPNSNQLSARQPPIERAREDFISQQAEALSKDLEWDRVVNNKNSTFLDLLNAAHDLGGIAGWVAPLINSCRGF